MDPLQLRPGYRVQITRDLGEGEQLYKAEITSIDHPFFFVHFIGYNSRLDAVVHFNEMDLTTVEVKKAKKRNIPKRNIESIYLNGYRTEPWYFSPYPASFADKSLYVCKFCLMYFHLEGFLLHNCNRRRPPGREVWRSSKNNICKGCQQSKTNGSLKKECVNQNNTCKFGVVHSIFELDGMEFKNYCRNLSLISKLFLDHKTLYYDVNAFIYYVLCRLEEDGFVVVGYFSKEKVSLLNYNLACILVFPFEQRKGYGKMIIDFSYILSNRDRRIQTCEKPFSDLGLLGYLSFWKDIILDFLVNTLVELENESLPRIDADLNESSKLPGEETALNNRSLGKISVTEISEFTGIRKEDVTHTLFHFKMIRFMRDDSIVFFVPETYQRKMQIDLCGLNPKAGEKYCYSKYRIQ
ncbi:Histone acetyltransferase esa1 [Cucumispora dikerogammari]|nr:Histone acetyltransferase esa1 [Cucumispora dikerogammari]